MTVSNPPTCREIVSKSSMPGIELKTKLADKNLPLYWIWQKIIKMCTISKGRPCLEWSTSWLSSLMTSYMSAVVPTLRLSYQLTQHLTSETFTRPQRRTKAKRLLARKLVKLPTCLVLRCFIPLKLRGITFTSPTPLWKVSTILKELPFWVGRGTRLNPSFSNH